MTRTVTAKKGSTPKVGGNRPISSDGLDRRKDGTLTRAAKRDMRDAAALAISAMSLGVSVAGVLLPLLNTKSDDGEDHYLVSEGYGPFRPE